MAAIIHINDDIHRKLKIQSIHRGVTLREHTDKILADAVKDKSDKSSKGKTK